MELNPITNLSYSYTSCHKCFLFQICQPTSKNDNETELVNRLFKKTRKLKRHEYLFRENNSFKTISVIRSGSVKTYTSINNAKEHVIGLHLPGQLLGLNAISTGHYTESAVALESCSICEIPYKQLEYLSETNPAIHLTLLQLLSQEIQVNHQHLALVSKESAQARLARFLLTISYNFKRRGFSATEFNLSMNRGDIANLLGLAVETISRLFSHFQETGLICAERKHIKLLDLDGLIKLSPNSLSLSN